MSWVEAFVLFYIAHHVGDYALQTDWQAVHKRGGLGRDPVARRALVSHIATYTLAFVPAIPFLVDDVGSGIAVAAAVGIPHLVQDDGRLLDRYMRAVKGRDVPLDRPVVTALDQTFHYVALLALAFVVAT